MPRTKKHKVFISFHVDDQKYKKRFVRMMGNNIVDKSVKDDDIDDTNLKVSRIRQIIRDDFIANATVTVVLIGPCTWKRKHVDWEIGSSLRETKKNPRCGLLGILLPDHPDFDKEDYDPHLIPPRLADNDEGKAPYARIYGWSKQTSDIRRWIRQAFERREEIPYPDNSREQFKHNRRGRCSRGWQN